MSAISALSSGTEGHYLPARFAGIPRLQRPGFDASRIEQDPFSVHHVVYPDMPAPETERSNRFVLFPDPVPPVVPYRPRPPPPGLFAQTFQPLQPPETVHMAPQLEQGPATAAAQPLAVEITPRSAVPSQLRTPTRVKVPSLAPLPATSQPGSLDGHSDRDVAAVRAHSPESHYEEESVYSGLQRRPYLIDRRPADAGGKRRSQ